MNSDDPRLTDHLVGELPADQAAEVERALAEDPALRQVFDQLTELRQVLTETLAPGADHLSPIQRSAVRNAARAADRDNAPILLDRRRPSSKPWQGPLAAAAAITLVACLWWFHPGRSNHDAVGHAPVSNASPTDSRQADSIPRPAPGPATGDISNKPAAPAAGLAAADLPALRVRGSVTAAACPTLDLPVRAGDASLGWIRDAVLTDHRLPSRDAVRLEEILNRFTFRPTGPAVVARQPAHPWHPDNRNLGTTTHAATLATETIACPWQPSASLVLIVISGDADSDCDVRAVFRADPAHVIRYRLLGFAPVADQPSPPLPARLPAHTSTALVLQIEPTTTARELGRLEWSVNGQAAEPLTLTPRDPTKEPSADARFAALVCTFAQWLTNDPAANIDNDMLAALARQAAATTTALPIDRTDFLNLIERALKL